MVKAYFRLLLDGRPLREMSTSAAIAKAGTYFLIGLFLALLWSSAARAQTATPTPFPSPTPYPTVTPVGTPQVTPTPDASGSTIVWACWLSPFSAGVCTWGDYFETPAAFDFREGTGSTLYRDPGPDGSDYYWVVFSPPANTRQMVATCTSRLTAQVWKSGGLSSPSAAATGRIDKDGSWSLLHNADGVYALGSEGRTVYESTASIGGDGEFDFFEPTNTFTWTLAGHLDVWPNADTLPNNYAAATSYARVGVRVQNQGGPMYSGAYSYGKIACEIDKIIRIDGTEYEPGTPVVDILTPEPCLPGDECWQVVPWPTPEPWLPGDPGLILTDTFGINPIGTVCHQMLPTFTFPGVTVFGYSVGGNSTPEFEVCLEEHSLNLTFFGWDFGVLVVAIAVLGMGGAFYGLMRMG